MNRPRDEHDLERLLGEDHGEFGALYRRLARNEPPRRLDRAVLGEAARAVRGRAPRRQRWLVAFGSAAGIVLAAGIAWRVGQEAAMQTSMPSAPTPTGVDIIPVQPIVERGRTSAESAPATRQVAPAAAPAGAHETSPRRAAAAARPAAKAVPATKPPTPPPPPAAVEQARTEPTPFPQAQHVDSAAGAGSGSRDERADAAAADGQAEAVREPESLRARAAPAPSASVQLRRDQQLAPAEWLAHVRELLRDGRRQQAAESLRLFHRTHPRHEVPEDLRHLLE